MSGGEELFLEGSCTCRAVRYRMTSAPLFVHCCHCRWCQRETGTAFALNAMIEADRVVLLEGSPEVVNTPSNSGKGQKIARCPKCRIALWSNYAGAGVFHASLAHPFKNDAAIDSEIARGTRDRRGDCRIFTHPRITRRDVRLTMGWLQGACKRGHPAARIRVWTAHACKDFC